MVDKGEYDEAIAYSVRKLQGKKKKKKKYVEALEKAFAKVTQRDMNRIAFVKEQKDGNYWGEIFDIVTNMDERQKTIEPLLPLISEDGYQAKFNFVRVEPLLIESEKKAVDYLYNIAQRLLQDGKNGDKIAARKAFEALDEINKYKSIYKDVVKLKQIAYDLGQDNVLIDVKNNSSVVLPRDFYRDVKNINTQDLNQMWLKFYTKEEKPMDEFDYIVDLNINKIIISPEREKEREYEETKKVKDGFTYLYDKDGNVKKDSLGNDLKEERYTIAKAKVFELFRNKVAVVRGDIIIKDLNRKTNYKSVPVNVDAAFESYASRFEGDERALSTETKNRLRKYPEPFPPNGELLMMAVDDLKNILLREIKDKLR
jgi:hypothetical protein